VSSGSSISIYDIPACLPDLRDAISDYDREADDAMGRAPDGDFTADDFEYARLMHPGELERFPTFDSFQSYVQKYIKGMRFDPLCQEESGLAVNELPLDIWNIPECVTFDGSLTLRSVLMALDSKADGGKSDGRFTEENFKKVKEVDRDLKRFATFGKFKKFIREYVDSKRCTEECRVERELAGDPENRGACYAPDEPGLPPMPKSAKPKMAKADPEKELKPKPDLSGFSHDYPRWLDDPAPYQGRSGGGRSPLAMQSMDELLASYVKNPFEVEVDMPVNLDREAMGWNASFDGKDFIFDLHGCYVKSVQDLTCIADWPYFIASLTNFRNGRHRTKHADSGGDVRVRVPAQIGDRVSAVGRDPNTNEYGLHKLIFEIDGAGQVRLVKRILLLPSGEDYASAIPTPREKVSMFFERYVSMVGPWIALLVDPKGAGRRYVDRVSFANVNGWSGEVSPANDVRRNGTNDMHHDGPPRSSGE